jgi:hypothetical protein
VYEKIKTGNIFKNCLVIDLSSLPRQEEGVFFLLPDSGKQD